MSLRALSPLLLLACAIAFPSLALPADALSLDALMRTAIAENHDLKAARVQVQAALGRLQQAGLRPNPRIEFTHDNDRIFANEGEYATSIGVSLDLPITGRLARAKNVANVDVARALTEVNEAERTLLGQIAASYYAVVALDDKIALLDRLLAIDQAMVAAATDRYRAGEVSELDVNTATLELERLRQQRALLTGDRGAALKALAGWVGYAVTETPAIDVVTPEVVAPSPQKELIDRALAERPELRMHALAVDRAEAEQVLAKAAAWEDWTVSLGVRQDKLAIQGSPVQSADRALMLSLAIPWPLFNRNQGTLAAARADAETAREQLTALRFRIQNDIAGKHEQLARLFAVLASYREQTLPLTRRNTALVHDAYQKGQASILEVVQVERQENDLNLTYADAVAQYLQVRAALDTAAVTFAPLMTRVVDPTARPSGEH